MGPYSILIYLSIAIILSYLFDIAARATKIPSVLMLLLTGIAIKQAVDYTGTTVMLPRVALELLGIVGLIMIVLEESLNLQLSRGKGALIRRSFAAAIVILLVQAFAIGKLLQLYLGGGVSFQSCLLNAIPLAVISSAVAIPSVAGLGEKQEFIVYESTFSDILGIMFFNFVAQDNFAQGISALTFTRDLVAILIVSVLSTAVLAFLLDRIRLHVKFFLVLAFLVLIYSLAKKLHLSSLLVVLVFGVTVKNAGLFLRGPLRRWFNSERLQEELHQLQSITAESAFLIRTFFFLLFGFSISLSGILDVHLLLQGLLIVAVLTLIRFFYLRYVARTSLIPEVFIAPKGLITILLFYSIPQQHLIGEVSENILFLVILLTGVLMLIGLQLPAKEKTELTEY